MIGSKCWIKTASSRIKARHAEYDGMDLDVLVDSGLATLTSKEVPDPLYNIGDIVVYNQGGPQCISMEHSVYKNMICRITNVSFHGKCIYYTIKNVLFNNERVGKVKQSVLPFKSSMYWFMDSHGKVQQTYFWFRPYEDAYRVATDNVFDSYDDAMKHLDNITKKIDFAKLTELFTRHKL